jgi:hypothetical protein
MSNSEESHDLKSFEAKLAALVPRGDRLDRERLIFLAGQASVTNGSNVIQPRTWQHHPIWPAAFATMSAVAATLLFLLVMRPVTSSVDDRNIATTDRPQPVRAAKSELLTAGDVIGGNLDQRLTRLSSTESLPPISIDQPPAPSLTPASWRRVTEGVSSPAPSSGTANPPVNQRATT